MHITSTINPLTKSSDDIPVLLLCYQKTRRFIVRPRRYADLVRLASEKLALDPDVVPTFQTSTLDICRGHNVEVDESAYQAMCTALDELTVVVHDDDDNDVGQRGNELGNRGLQKGKTPQAPMTPPFTWEDDRGGKAASRAVEEEEEEEEEEGKAGSSASIYNNPSQIQEQSKQNLTGKDVVVGQEEVEEVEVEEEEAEENVSGSRHDANIQRGQPEIEIISHPSPGKKTISQTTTTNETSRKSISVAVSGKLPTPNPSNSGTESSSSRVKPDPEARYTVIINGPPDQEAEFKTRGKHLVKKVLAGACKTFGLDLARAHLIVAKSVNGDVKYFECPLEQTMARCGVETGKRFHIHIDEEVDELQEDS